MPQAVLEQNSLELPAARVIDLRRGATDDAARRLQESLRSGLAVDQDLNRPDFYRASIGDARYYFHVFRRRSRVYLLACRP